MNARIWVVLASAVLASCSDAQAPDGSVETSTGIELALTTLGSNGTEYRLAPASFTIQRTGSSDPATVVDASADQSTVMVPLIPGMYSVSLQPGWQLNRVPTSGSIEPVPATLQEGSDKTVDVRDYETTPVTYDFRIGQTQLAIGVMVKEDPYPGSDGEIQLNGNGLYEIYFNVPARACCFSSIAEARAAYPGLNLTVR